MESYFQNDILNYDSFLSKQINNKFFIGVGKCEASFVRNYADERGFLSAGEFPTDFPFLIKRYFFISNVPLEAKRGEHAHKICKQFMICIKGSCKVLLDDSKNKKIVSLDSPKFGIFVPNLIWGSQFEYSKDAVLLVFASHPYDTKEYIRNYQEFKKLCLGT